MVGDQFGEFGGDRCNVCGLGSDPVKVESSMGGKRRWRLGRALRNVKERRSGAERGVLDQETDRKGLVDECR